jgi:BatD DUF11 like domain
MVRRVLAIVLALIALGATPAGEAQVSVQASVDRPVVHDNESFTLSIRAEGPLRGEPEEGPLAQSFDILGRSSNSRVQILNGRTSQVTEWQYQLMPKAAGEFTIPPLRVADTQSNAVSVRVLPTENGNDAAADVFIELTTDPKTVYVQAQVLLTLRLYVGVSTGRATLTVPETNGVEAIVEKLGDDTSYQTKRGGRDFIVRERRYAVFPQAAGKLTLGPVTFEAMVIPDRGFSRVQRFRSGVVDLDVKPAVAPPASMSGAAWLPAQRVTLAEEWSDPPADLAVGIPRTRKILIEGLGLLETQLPDIDIESPPGVRQYADQPELTREVTPAGLLSRRSVSLAVIAQTPGDASLAALRLPWWNVAEGRWEVAELPARTLHVTPSVEAPAPSSASAPVSAPPAAVGAPRTYWPLVSAVLALAWLATALGWWRDRRAAAAGLGRGAAAQDRRPALRRVLRDLESACAVGATDAARKSLLELAEAKYPSAPPRSLGALAALLPAASAREVLALEAHIYGVAPGSWEGAGLKAVLAEVAAAGEEGEPNADEPLLPLYR